uniref:(northern house mosquito) hypothetical protein n=1 Tax=Culex pipiens TaxID=7175 RepID=A0A8D8E7J7_CULPI
MGRGPPGEAGLAAGVAVRGRTQHDGAPVGPVRTQRAERGRLRAEAGPPADVRVAFAQDSGAGAGSRWGTAGLWGVGVVRDDAILARRVLLVPVGDVEPLQGRLDAQLVFAQVGAGFVRLLEFVLRGQNISLILLIQQKLHTLVGPSGFIDAAAIRRRLAVVLNPINLPPRPPATTVSATNHHLMHLQLVGSAQFHERARLPGDDRLVGVQVGLDETDFLLTAHDVVEEAGVTGSCSRMMVDRTCGAAVGPVPTLARYGGRSRRIRLGRVLTERAVLVQIDFRPRRCRRGSVWLLGMRSSHRRARPLGTHTNDARGLLRQGWFPAQHVVFVAGKSVASRARCGRVQNRVRTERHVGRVVVSPVQFVCCLATLQPNRVHLAEIALLFVIILDDPGGGGRLNFTVIDSI